MAVYDRLIKYCECATLTVTATDTLSDDAFYRRDQTEDNL